MSDNCSCWDAISVTVCLHYPCISAETVECTLLCMLVTLYILCKYPILRGIPSTNSSSVLFFPLFCCVGAPALLCFAAKLTFTGVCPPPVILSTPSLCGAQPSKTSDRQANGSGGLQQHNTLLLPPLRPVVRFYVQTHTTKRRGAIPCSVSSLLSGKKKKKINKKKVIRDRQRLIRAMQSTRVWTAWVGFHLLPSSKPDTKNWLASDDTPLIPETSSTEHCFRVKSYDSVGHWMLPVSSFVKTCSQRRIFFSLLVYRHGILLI